MDSEHGLHEKLVLRWHPTLNGDLRPTDVSPGSHRKVWWQCEEGHSWQAAIFSVVINGCDCPYCAGKKAIPGKTDLMTLFPDVAKQLDAERNGDLDPGQLSPSAHEKVWWKCELGHSWQAPPFSRTRTRSAGCPYCAGRKVLPGFNDLKTLRPWLGKEWYQPLNGELKPTDVTPGSNKKVWWRCSENHVWQATIYARAKQNGTGCPVCAGLSRRSRVMYIEDKKAAQLPKQSDAIRNYRQEVAAGGFS